MVTHWFLDFDDTLASGSTTWGLKHALPKLIREHRLPFDQARFAQAALAAQERVADSPDLGPVVDELFDAMGWPRALQQTLIDDVLSAYQPELFADALPFLQRLAAARHSVYILSNNPRAVVAAERLRIAPHIARCFTPETDTGGLAKPDPRLWDRLTAVLDGVSAHNAAIVGDDPWTDGAFAQRCGLRCWLVDRDGRFAHLYGQSSARWVASLADIPVE